MLLGCALHLALEQSLLLHVCLDVGFSCPGQVGGTKAVSLQVLNGKEDVLHLALEHSSPVHVCLDVGFPVLRGWETKGVSLQVLNGKEDALHLASQHTQAEENQRSMRGFLCPLQPSQQSDFQPMQAAGAMGDTHTSSSKTHSRSYRGCA